MTAPKDLWISVKQNIAGLLECASLEMSTYDHVAENATYEDYLDSQLDHSDLFFLEV